MKKKALSAALAAAFVLTTAGTVFADPLEFNGEVSYQHRENTHTGADDITNNIFKIQLNGKAANVIDNVDLFFRFGGSSVSDAVSGRDFTTGYPGVPSDERNVFALDEFGFIYKSGGFNYKIGRQEATVGATALLYNNNYFVGKHSMVDGVTITGKSGATSISAIAAEDDFYGQGDKLYAVSGSYKPSEKLTVGATLGKYDSAANVSGKDENHWAVNASYDFTSKLGVFGEYAQSSASDDNKAYDIGLTYAFDKKTSLYVINHEVEKNGDMGGMTDFDNDYKGMYYGINHKFDKTSTLKFFYKDNKQVSDTSIKDTSFRTTFVYSF